MLRLLPCCLLALSGCYYPLYDIPEPEPAFISGRVVDAQTGQPVEGALVSTEPPTTTTTTNSQGMFTLETQPLSNTIVVGLVADKPGLRQRETTCIAVTPADNASADVQLLANNAEECASSCTDGNICLGGICASACNPVCACDERCEDGRCVADSSTTTPERVVDGGSGSSSGGSGISSGSGSSSGGTGSCPPDTVQSATGCVQKPLLGDWRVEVDLGLDHDGNLGTYADRSTVSIVWEFDVYDVRFQSGYWAADFGNGRQVSLSGTRLTAPTGSHPQDYCSANDPLHGFMKLTTDGALSIEDYGTGLIACARIDGGYTWPVLGMGRVISNDGFNTTIVLNDPESWGANPPQIQVLSVSGVATISR